MRIAVIPARGGSKRIPRKNIRLFAGRQILIYSVRAALDSGCFDQVLVSTDDEEIADVAHAAGASVPFMRPPELADDFTVLADVIAHAIQWFDAQGHHVDAACCVFATAPFLTATALRVGLAALQKGGVDFSLAVTSYAFPVQRAIRMTPDGAIDAMYPEFRSTRSQDLEPGWHDAGQFCWGTRQAFLERRPVFSLGTMGVVLPRHLVQDLDTLEDWHRAELMYEVLQRTGELS